MLFVTDTLLRDINIDDNTRKTFLAAMEVSQQIYPRIPGEKCEQVFDRFLSLWPMAKCRDLADFMQTTRRDREGGWMRMEVEREEALNKASAQSIQAAETFQRQRIPDGAKEKEVTKRVFATETRPNSSGGIAAGKPKVEPKVEPQTAPEGHDPVNPPKDALADFLAGKA